MPSQPNEPRERASPKEIARRRRVLFVIGVVALFVILYPVWQVFRAGY
jgi:hypothetical protein